MDAEKRLGIILIIIGLLIPLAALPFVSGFSKDKDFYDNFYNAGIDIRRDATVNTPSQPIATTKETNSKTPITWSMLIPHRIPLRFILVPTVILVYLGIIRIDRSRRKKHDF